MAFHDVKLDDDIAYGMEAGPGFSTVVQVTASGHEYRVSRQAQGRHRYRATKELLTLEQFSELKDFFIARRGALHGFRFKDWSDFTTAEDGTASPAMTDVVLGTGNGTDQTFQLIKTYDGSGPNPYARTITLPVAGTVVAALDGVSTASFSLTNPGGVLTFSSAPANGVVVTAGCAFDVPVRFATQTEEWLRARYSDFARIAWESFELEEVLSEVQTPELRWPGGSSATIVTAVDQAITPHLFVWPFQVSAAINVFLPPPDRLAGGEQFLIYNVAASSNTVTVRDDAGVAVTGALASNTVRRVALIRDGSTATWVAY